MAIYVALIGSGLGDVVVCRPVLDHLVAQKKEPVYLVVRGPRQVGTGKLIDGLAGEVLEPEVKNLLKEGDRYINLRDHPLQRQHDWFSPAFQSTHPGMTIQKVVQTICSDMSISLSMDEFRPFHFQSDKRASGKIIFVPSTTMTIKTLHPDFWLNLQKALQQRHQDVIMLGSLEHSSQMQHLAKLGILHIPSDDIQDAVNLISSCSGVVSVDTGLMHIAVQQGIRTVAIFGEWHLYYRVRKNCYPIFAAQPPEAKPYVTQEKDFGCDYDNWNYFPPDHDTGSPLAFNDVMKVVELLYRQEATASH
jgi:ADP-heptose:LPS heptosyltransferase